MLQTVVLQQLITDGVSDGYGDGAVQEDHFQQQEAEPYQNDHQAIGAGNGYDKWDDEEEDWEAQQRQQEEEGNYPLTHVLHTLHPIDTEKLQDMMSIQLILVAMTVPLLVLEVATLAELGLLGRISTGMCTCMCVCLSLPSCTSTRRGCFFWLLINITYGPFCVDFLPL